MTIREFCRVTGFPYEMVLHLKYTEGQRFLADFGLRITLREQRTKRRLKVSPWVTE